MKATLTLLFFAVCAAVACAQTYSVDVRTDRADAFYRMGQKAVFFVKVNENGAPLENARIFWRLTKDSLEPPMESGFLTLENGTASFSGTLDEPGFLQCRVDFKAPDGKTFGNRAGAAFEPLQIRQSRPAPADFDSFWDAQRAALKKIPLNLKLTEVPSGNPNIKTYDVQADCGDIGISAYLSVPANAKRKSCPAILTTRGANLGKTLDWAREGFIAMDFNVHGLPNGKPPAYYDGLYKTELKDYFCKGRESRDTCYFKGLYTRLMRALDILAARPEWDGKTLVVWGGSQGGAQAFAAAGLDARVSLFCAEIPALCDLTGVSIDRTNGWPTNKFGYPNPDNTPRDMTEAELNAAQYFDSANFAARAKGEAFVTVGFADGVCPPTTGFAAYNAIPTPKRMLTMPLTPHKSTPESLSSIRLAILEHAAKMRAQK